MWLYISQALLAMQSNISNLTTCTYMSNFANYIYSTEALTFPSHLILAEAQRSWVKQYLSQNWSTIQYSENIPQIYSQDRFLLMYHGNTYQYAGQWRDQWLTTENSDHQPTEKNISLDNRSVKVLNWSLSKLLGNSSMCLDYFQQKIIFGGNSLQITWHGQGDLYLTVAPINP